MAKTQEELNSFKHSVKLDDEDLSNVVGGQDVESTIENLKTLTRKINTASNTNADANRQPIQGEMDTTVCQISADTLSTFNGKILSDGSENLKRKIG